MRDQTTTTNMPASHLNTDFHEKLVHGISTADLPTYVYSYPSKRAYRKMDGVRLSDIWNGNEKGAVNLYLHIPFCRYRCTYCTLFLTTKITDDVLERYVDKLCEQIALYAKFAGQRTVSSIYFGGGTPTVLNEAQFGKIFAALRASFPMHEENAEICVEGSPDSFSAQILDCLKRLGVNRISMGLQTMHPRELKESGRPYPVEESISAIQRIAERFTHFNLDLIYGLSGQTEESWFDSLHQVIGYGPSTISLYPVVSRPLTSLERLLRNKAERYIDDNAKYAIYNKNVDILSRHGYRQESFTRFTRLPRHMNAYAQEANDFNGVPLIGFGTGARSYKDHFHYSFDYAVGTREVSKIIDGYLEMELDEQNVVQYGIELSEEEERRRFVLLTLTLNQLSQSFYKGRFKRDLIADFGAELNALIAQECIEVGDGGKIELTPKGFKFSSLIASLFFSESIINKESEYVNK